MNSNEMNYVLGMLKEIGLYWPDARFDVSFDGRHVIVGIPVALPLAGKPPEVALAIMKKLEDCHFIRKLQDELTTLRGLVDGLGKALAPILKEAK